MLLRSHTASHSRISPSCFHQNIARPLPCSHRWSSKRSVRSCITRAGGEGHDDDEKLVQQQPPSGPPQQDAPSPQQQQQAQQQQVVQPPQQQPPQQQPVAQQQQQQIRQQQPQPARPPAQQQQQPQQQRTAPPATSQQQQQQAAPATKQRPSWLQLVVQSLQRMPGTLTAFLVGGLAASLLLFGWAKGSPMRKNQPYSFTMTFDQASKLDVGTPVRMKGVQIGTVTSVQLQPSHIKAVAEVADASNVIPRSSRVDINLLGLAADPWIDITPPAGCLIRRDHGPHHPECKNDGLIVCHNGLIAGSQGGSTDFMMKFFLSQHDRTRTKTADTIYHSKQQ